MRLPDELDFIARPVRAGLCKLYELKDGTYDLADVAFFHDLLDVEAENKMRFEDAAKAQQG